MVRVGRVGLGLCGVVWCGVVRCGVVWCGGVWCGAVGWGEVWCMVLCGAIHYTVGRVVQCYVVCRGVGSVVVLCAAR